MRRGESGIHSCRLTPERGVRYGLRRCKIAIEVPSKIVILAGADSPLKFLYFPSSFLEGFPPSSSFGFSFFFSLFTIVFRLLSFFLLKIRNDEKKTFLLRFSFSFLLVEKKERKKRKRVRSVLGGMMKMMLLGWEQLPFFVFISCSKSLQNSFTQFTRFLHVLWISYNHKQRDI